MVAKKTSGFKDWFMVISEYDCTECNGKDLQETINDHRDNIKNGGEITVFQLKNKYEKESTLKIL